MRSLASLWHGFDAQVARCTSLLWRRWMRVAFYLGARHVLQELATAATSGSNAEIAERFQALEREVQSFDQQELQPCLQQTGIRVH